MSDPKLVQIIAAHKSAKPSRERNFAWWSTHRDLAYVLEVLEETQRSGHPSDPDETRQGGGPLPSGKE